MLYKIADVVFEIQCLYDLLNKLLAPFAYNGQGSVDCIIDYDESDVEAAKTQFDFDNISSVESLYVFKRIAEYITLNKDGMLFHCSSFAYNGQGVLIAADSGTGKSTHSRFWRQLYGSSVKMINDDKPFIRRIDGVYYVYGSPWMGKHYLGCNDRAPIKAICLLNRAEENSVIKQEKGQSFGEFLSHGFNVFTPEGAMKILDFCQGLVEQCDLYILNAKFDVSAAQVCHDALFGEV